MLRIKVDSESARHLVKVRREEEHTTNKKAENGREQEINGKEGIGYEAGNNTRKVSESPFFKHPGRSRRELKN